MPLWVCENHYQCRISLLYQYIVDGTSGVTSLTLQFDLYRHAGAVKAFHIEVAELELIVDHPTLLLATADDSELNLNLLFASSRFKGICTGNATVNRWVEYLMLTSTDADECYQALAQLLHAPKEEVELLFAELADDGVYLLEDTLQADHFARHLNMANGLHMSCKNLFIVKTLADDITLPWTDKSHVAETVMQSVAQIDTSSSV